MGEVVSLGVEAGPLLWCVVANVAAETTHGPGGQEVQQGLKHFAPGAKVWVLPQQWGDGGECVLVIGRHRGRGPGRLVRIVVARVHLVNFRVQGVYRGAVHRELVRPWQPTPYAHWDGPLHQWESRAEAEEVAAWWNTAHARRAGVSQPRRRGDLLDVLAIASGTVAPWWELRFVVRRLVEELFGNPADVPAAVGGLLRDQAEVDAITGLLGPLRAIADELGLDRSDADYLGHRDWPSVTAAARLAYPVLTTQSAD
ncbi:SCO4402 family protein [Crossiella sp. CA198]|uniref:SCO4402 family protein n=1 Tax=Crossiella sp. CA198 TaxID=3455607 RepID=UPI003F8D1418